MKHFAKQLLFVCGLIASDTLLCYELHFSNFTSMDLVLMCKKRAGIQEKFYQVVESGSSVIQVWDDANCLEAIQWAELNKKLPLKGGLDLVDAKQGYQIPRDKQDTFRKTFTNIGDKGKNLYLWNNLKIVIVPNEIYKKTREAATKLMKGFDKLVCQTIDAMALNLGSRVQKEIIKKVSGTKNECLIKLGQIADAAGKINGISICKNRSFGIYETGETDFTGMPLLVAETGEGE